MSSDEMTGAAPNAYGGFDRRQQPPEVLPQRTPGASPETPPSGDGSEPALELSLSMADPEQPALLDTAPSAAVNDAPSSHGQDPAGLLQSAHMAAAPATPPTGGLSDQQIASLAEDVVKALAEYDALGPWNQATADEASQLLVELAQLRMAVPASHDERRTRVWNQLVTAREAHRVLLEAPRVDAAVGPTDLANAEVLLREFEHAEAKARRSMSGPGAFKKFAVARKALTEHFDRFGVDSYEELKRLAERSAPVDADALATAAARLAQAEAEWVAVDQVVETAGLGSDPQADALRVRAFRVIGSFVDDDQLEPRLRELADGGAQRGPILARLTLTLRALGLPEGMDPIDGARVIQQQVRGA